MVRDEVRRIFFVDIKREVVVKDEKVEMNLKWGFLLEKWLIEMYI